MTLYSDGARSDLAGLLHLEVAEGLVAVHPVLEVVLGAQPELDRAVVLRAAHVDHLAVRHGELVAERVGAARRGGAVVGRDLRLAFRGAGCRSCRRRSRRSSARSGRLLVLEVETEDVDVAIGQLDRGPEVRGEVLLLRPASSGLVEAGGPGVVAVAPAVDLPRLALGGGPVVDLEAARAAHRLLEVAAVELVEDAASGRRSASSWRS